MACDGAYAEAWQFASFWCIEGYAEGAHEGAGPVDAALQDTEVDFISEGAVINTGQLLYNVTQGTSGPVTGATTTTLTATGVTWAAGDLYRVAFISQAAIARIDQVLQLSAGNIHTVRAAQVGCDCTEAAWAPDELAKLNVILAGTLYNCRCASPHLSDTDQKESLFNWAEGILEQVRDGLLEFCDGYGGKNYPAFGIVEQSTTLFAAEEIIRHRWQRELT